MLLALPIFLISSCVFADVGSNSSQTDNLQPDDKLLLDKTIIKLLEEKHSYSNGDVLIGSATVFAFVGFGSFLILKFESKRVKYLLDLTNYSLLCIYAIEASQIYIMISIVENWFNSTLYEILMVMTAIALGLILFFVRQIIGEENPEREKQTTKVAGNWLTFFNEVLQTGAKK